MMNRRRFLKTTAATAAAAAIGAKAESLAQASEAASKPAAAPAEGVPRCGLYCGICGSKAAGECHGCGCSCGKCAGAAHAAQCEIAKCAAQRSLESCADCGDLPCTKLIQFSLDPIWRTHSVCIENLRRRKAIGTAAWLKEQQQYWTDNKKAAERWLALYADCDRRCAKWNQTKTL